MCGRRLTDPDSVKKGIGPICEKKIKKMDRVWRKAGLDQGYFNLELYPHGLDISKLSAEIDRIGPKCNCGETLRGSNVEHYKHGSGIKVIGYQDLQWIYVHCDNCNYDMALWKIKELRDSQ